MKKIFNFSKQTKKLITGILIITCAAFLTAWTYYSGKNRAEDPRVVRTKFILKEFDELMKVNDFSTALPLLDTIESILTRVPGYSESYESGLVYNNRGSVYLNLALYNDKDSTEKMNLLYLAKKNIDSSIFIYNRWLDRFRTLSKEELVTSVKPFFPENCDAFKGRNYRKILIKRVEDLFLAQKETPRRLSVCYTNLGIVLRHQHKQEEAADSYIMAIRLWKDNYTARNNFNVLMGKPPRDRSIITQLFPPDKRNFN